MDDCQSPKCHENMSTAMNKLVSKRALWTFCVIIGIPLFATGIKVWSQSESSHLQFAGRGEMVEIEKKQIETQTVVKSLTDSIKNIRESQDEIQKDIKRILNRLPKNNYPNE